MNFKFWDVWWLFAWVFIISMFAGIVRILRGYKLQHLSGFEVVGELCVSGFLGMMTFLLCVATKFLTIPTSDYPSAAATAFLCGIMAHAGTRALALFERSVLRQVGKALGDNDIDAPAAVSIIKLDENDGLKK